MKVVAQESVHAVSFSVSEMVLRQSQELRSEQERGTTYESGSSGSVHLEWNGRVIL